MRTFDHKAIEEKWQKKWIEEGRHKTLDRTEEKENYFFLVEFPYPSGNLHIGHWYAFAVPDIFVRFMRMNGKNILYPIGFDAFGLPAENAAIKRGLDPRKWTFDNIEHMRGQLRSMGNSFDWSREVITANPDYYKWTQWLFLQLYKKGLAYKKKATVNWCDKDKTVLANEQVVAGACERCGTPVVQKDLEQWFLKITDYAERLLNDLDDLAWPEQIKEAQRNWIGKSEGAEIEFPISNFQLPITVFTTRPDTLYGATYVVLAPEHALLEILKDSIENWNEVASYQKTTKSKTEIERTAEGKEKTGVELKGIKAINPATKEEIPVWIADYVLAQYGTGAIMAVPAHDERDRDFAETFHLSIKAIVPEPSKEKITISVGGRMVTKYKLRDWLLSRQRYWGCPIPIVYDPEGLPHAIPDEHLPWTLAQDVDFTPTGEPPLASSKELKERTEKIFGKGWRSEYDTMDTFIDSSWYYLRYLDPHNDTEFSSKEKQKLWMPVQRYSGGAEHTTMHLLYSRFFHKALFDLGLVGGAEPYAQRMNRGLILGPDGQKMSKSKGNVIDPDAQVERVGADTVKMYLAFIGPYNEPGQYPWDLGGLAGIRRFLERVWRMSDQIETEARNHEDASLILELDATIKKVGEDINIFKFNTAISELMKFTNILEQYERIPVQIYETLLVLLAPFAPHLTEELWEKIGHEHSIHGGHWPTFNADRLAQRPISVVIQIDGKARGTVTVAKGSPQVDVEAQARISTSISRHLAGKNIEKIVYIPDRALNFVLSKDP